MDADAQLDGFIDKFAPDIAALTRALLVRLKARLPGATIMVYDNYNALAIAFGATDRVSKAALSLAVYPKRPSLFFVRGKDLPDPHHLLQGQGNQVRYVPLPSVELLDDPRVDALIDLAVARSEPPFDPAAVQRLIIKSVSAKQRPRRPTAAGYPALAGVSERR
jgi:hypothetical protein